MGPEAPQDDCFTGKAANRTSVRSCCCILTKCAGLLRMQVRYPLNCMRPYGLRVRKSRISTIPDEIAGDAGDLVKRVRQLVEVGQIASLNPVRTPWAICCAMPVSH